MPDARPHPSLLASYLSPATTATTSHTAHLLLNQPLPTLFSPRQKEIVDESTFTAREAWPLPQSFYLRDRPLFAPPSLQTVHSGQVDPHFPECRYFPIVSDC